MKGIYPVEIRFNDIDLAGHVHNSVYLAYFSRPEWVILMNLLVLIGIGESRG